MTVHGIAVYHNAESRFLPYEDGHPVTQVISYQRDLPDASRPERAADLVFHLFNVDLDQLEVSCGDPVGQADFLIACVYRLLGLRSLSVGDVVAVSADRHVTWLACDPVGWRSIGAPSRVSGQPLSADMVYARMRERREPW